MDRCWCGQVHKKDDVRNGEVKHSVFNWKLYELRKDRQEKESKEVEAKIS